MSDFHGMTTRHGTLSVSVDITNPKEVEILKELLLMWTTYTMIELEILFKVYTFMSWLSSHYLDNFLITSLTHLSSFHFRPTMLLEKKKVNVIVTA